MLKAGGFPFKPTQEGSPPQKNQISRALRFACDSRGWRVASDVSRSCPAGSPTRYAPWGSAGTPPAPPSGPSGRRSERPSNLNSVGGGWWFVCFFGGLGLFFFFLVVWGGLGWFGVVGGGWGGLGWFGVVWGGLGWFGVVWGGLGWFGGQNFAQSEHIALPLRVCVALGQNQRYLVRWHDLDFDPWLCVCETEGDSTAGGGALHPGEVQEPLPGRGSAHLCLGGLRLARRFCGGGGGAGGRWGWMVSETYYF